MNPQQQETTLVFGTDGVRGHADQFPFNDTGMYAFGKGIAAWAQEKYQKTSPVMLVGMDTRLSGPRIKQALIRGLIDGQACVIDAGVLPTPAVYKLLTLHGAYDKAFNVGIMISASHNHYYDNGIKIFDALSCKISSDDEKLIIQKINFFLGHNQNQEVGSSHIEPALWLTALDVYKSHVESHFPTNFLKNIKVVLDCAHGAMSKVAPAVFKSLGAEVYTIADRPDGKNINDGCGAVHPEYLAKEVQDLQADCGFAFDGDGDRVVVIDSSGNVKDGDDVLALLAQHSSYNKASHIVGTVMSNQGLEVFLTHKAKQLVRTQVGDKYVMAAMRQEHLPLGGEPSGHIIIYDYMPTSDALYVALKTIESIKINENWKFISFQKFPQVLVNVCISNKRDLASPPLASVISEYEYMLDGGRLLVRYSGTEPILRVMAEAASYEIASKVAHELATKLQRELYENS